MKVPRQASRASGRTAMYADVSVFDAPPPDDRDAPMSFSMEGYPGQPPAPLIARYQAPRWNSVQALNKFQEEVAGPLRGGDPGVRLIEPPAPTPQARPARPPPRRRGAGQTRPPGRLLAVPLHHIYGSEELSMLSPPVAGRGPGALPRPGTARRGAPRRAPRAGRWPWRCTAPASRASACRCASTTSLPEGARRPAGRPAGPALPRPAGRARDRRRGRPCLTPCAARSTLPRAAPLVARRRAHGALRPRDRAGRAGRRALHRRRPHLVRAPPAGLLPGPPGAQPRGSRRPAAAARRHGQDVHQRGLGPALRRPRAVRRSRRRSSSSRCCWRSSSCR